MKFSQTLLIDVPSHLTSGTMSRLLLSFKSLPGVKDDMAIHDGPGDGGKLL